MFAGHLQISFFSGMMPDQYRINTVIISECHRSVIGVLPDFTGCQFFSQIRPLVAEGDCLLGIIRGSSAKHLINARYKNGICTIYKWGTSAMHPMTWYLTFIGCIADVPRLYIVHIPFLYHALIGCLADDPRIGDQTANPP